MSKFGYEFTGQPFLNTGKCFIACPICGKAITASGTGWFDSHCKVEFPNNTSNGVYVCKEHLSQERKDEINGDRHPDHPANFESEKKWVESEQNLIQKPGALERLLVNVSKYANDTTIMNGVSTIIKTHLEMT
jgi:hypothetical protein